jgi:ATP-dependent helicase/nuclease subunit B
MDAPSAPKAPELVFLERRLFSYGTAVYPGQNEAVKIYSAPTRYAECEYAAHKVWGQIRDGYRWRDIGVVSRDWDEYGSICENVFEKYGIPFFSSGRADILISQRPALSTGRYSGM